MHPPLLLMLIGLIQSRGWRLVYLFWSINSTTTLEWTQVEKFVAADGETYINMEESSIAVDNNIVFVGAPNDDSSSRFTEDGFVHILDTGFSSSKTRPTAEPKFSSSTTGPTPKPVASAILTSAQPANQAMQW
jgi:hypothetical protein